MRPIRPTLRSLAGALAAIGRNRFVRELVGGYLIVASFVAGGLVLAAWLYS